MDMHAPAVCGQREEPRKLDALARPFAWARLGLVKHCREMSWRVDPNNIHYPDGCVCHSKAFVLDLDHWLVGFGPISSVWLLVQHEMHAGLQIESHVWQTKEKVEFIIVWFGDEFSKQKNHNGMKGIQGFVQCKGSPNFLMKEKEKLPCFSPYWLMQNKKRIKEGKVKKKAERENTVTEKTNIKAETTTTLKPKPNPFLVFT
ncbi:hypothetical protein Fmac_013957 [Flemingia macrophylla]|uniref:Uncharacterized protein n=1 Tax=Flemingia macrophylla TaxID=520843 RepID=A0ABD1MAF3_9FABA